MFERSRHLYSSLKRKPRREVAELVLGESRVSLAVKQMTLRRRALTYGCTQDYGDGRTVTTRSIDGEKAD